MISIAHLEQLTRFLLFCGSISDAAADMVSMCVLLLSLSLADGLRIAPAASRRATLATLPAALAAMSQRRAEAFDLPSLPAVSVPLPSEFEAWAARPTSILPGQDYIKRLNAEANAKYSFSASAPEPAAVEDEAAAPPAPVGEGAAAAPLASQAPPAEEPAE